MREEAIDILDKAYDEEVGMVLWSHDSHVIGNDLHLIIVLSLSFSHYLSH